MRHFDVPSDFLNVKLSKEVYIEVNVKESKSRVIELNKAFSGLKESPLCWNESFD